ncbi:MAG TPA: hypothetical protein VJ063_04060, partial [Verrucomicrobiae bacterium]|nr:hypothetical protein [Verrucomicrobiae bacterium]
PKSSPNPKSPLPRRIDQYLTTRRLRTPPKAVSRVTSGNPQVRAVAAIQLSFSPGPAPRPANSRSIRPASQAI